MTRVTLTLEDRPDGSVATSMEVEGDASEGASLSPALIYGMTIRALQESALIDDHAVVVMSAISNGERPSEALLNGHKNE